MKRNISLLPMLLAAAIGIAQNANDTINRMVLVESTYNPIIAGAVKHNFIPEEVKPSVNKEEVVYAEEGIGLTHFDRQAQTAKAVDVASEKGTPGYAHLGYGNYNNLSALAAYKLQLGERSGLALKAHADGWNGNLKLVENIKWRSYLNDVGLDADYTMQLDKATLNAGVGVADYTYNYLAYSTPNGGTDTQNAYNLDAYLNIKGVVKEHYHYRAAISYTHFNRSTHFAYNTRNSENHLHSEITFGMDLYEWGMASIELRYDLLSYQGLADYHNYGSFGITPKWEYQYSKFKFIGGFNMDFLAGKHTLHPVQLSPECSISYVPNKVFAAKFTLDGGRDLPTFGNLYEMSPYWASTKQLRPSYTFLNARLEGGVRIFEGLHLHLGGGYKVVSDALFETVMDSLGMVYSGITNHNAQVATVDGSINYIYKDLVNLSAKSAYYHWMLKGDRSLLARAPRFDVDVDARVRILPQLHAYTNLKLVSFTYTKVVPRERSIIDWSLGANYTFNKRFSFFLDAHNLLNRRYSYYTGYPAQGFNVMAGAIVKF